MEILDLDRYFEDEALQAEVERAARRERAKAAHQLLARAADALLGRGEAAVEPPLAPLRRGHCG